MVRRGAGPSAHTAPNARRNRGQTHPTGGYTHCVREVLARLVVFSVDLHREDRDLRPLPINRRAQRPRIQPPSWGVEPPDFCAHLAQYEGGPCSTAKKRCGANAVSLYTANRAITRQDRRLIHIALRSYRIGLERQPHAARCITWFAVGQARPLILRQTRAENRRFR